MGKLVCIGGGENGRLLENGNYAPYETLEIDEEIVKLSDKENPELLFIGTASKDNNEYFLAIKDIFEKLGCNVYNLNLLEDNLDNKNIKRMILNTDIIYVGGGDTRFMLQRWRELGIDKLLLQAYNMGIVCSGLSAGSYCWFKYNYDLIEGLGIIDAVNCVHYEEKDEIARNKFYDVIKEKKLDGIALENCTALKIVDGKMNVIKSNKDRNAYKITYKDGNFIETIIE